MKSSAFEPDLSLFQALKISRFDTHPQARRDRCCLVRSRSRSFFGGLICELIINKSGGKTKPLKLGKARGGGKGEGGGVGARSRRWYEITGDNEHRHNIQKGTNPDRD